nr:protein ovarian tumor locus isoform X2 [Parasteatoda tepidariorum]
MFSAKSLDSNFIFYTQVHHVKLREVCIEYMERNRCLFDKHVNEDFDAYLEKIKDPKEWVGELEMKALSLKYKLDFVVYYDPTKPPLKIQVPSPVQTIALACTGGNRYDCVYSKCDLSTLAFSQSMIYEVLYKKVYGLGSDVDIAVEKMLHDKAYSKQRRSNLLCNLFRDNCRIEGLVEDNNLPEDDQVSLKVGHTPRLEIRKALAQGVPPFPYKVAKTLDPGIYRNVEFDLWNEKRKEEQKSEQFIIPKLEAGVKCKVHINKDVYIGHVQEVFSDCEDVSIYIEELCKKCVVSSSVLEIVPVPAYKAMTWQGGKTYKVCVDCANPGSEAEKLKNKKSYKKNFQDNSPTHNSSNVVLKPDTITRSNSMPSSVQRNLYNKGNRRKGHSTSAPVSHRSKSVSQKDSVNTVPLRPSNYPCMWNGMHQAIPTSPIPIPGKMSSDCYHIQHNSPELLSDTNDSGWTECSLKSPLPLSPPSHYTLASVYPEDGGYSSMTASSPYSTPCITTNATSMPLSIPGTQPPSPPVGDEVPATTPTTPCPTAMAVYPYPVYAVPGMYLVCRDGSTLPVNIGTWGTQESVNNEVPAGVPSVIFNTPPGGISPPLTSWMPATVGNYGPTWTPAAVAFSPPLDMNAYQSVLSPTWSPSSGIYLPPGSAVAYQVHQPHILPPVPAPHEHQTSVGSP